MHAVDRNPTTSVRALDVGTRKSETTVRRVLQGEVLHPFQVQRMQLLESDDHTQYVKIC